MVCIYILCILINLKMYFWLKVASIITYPHEVLRARLQDDRDKYSSAIRVVKKIVKDEGLFSLWSGYRVNLVRIFPATISTFLAYEYINKMLKEMNY